MTPEVFRAINRPVGCQAFLPDATALPPATVTGPRASSVLGPVARAIVAWVAETLAGHKPVATREALPGLSAHPPGTRSMVP